MQYVCGVPEMFGAGSPTYKLHTKRPTWSVIDTLPGFTRDQLEAIVAEAFRVWGEVCDIVGDKHTNPKTQPTEIVTVADLGAGGTLADQELPTGRSQYRMRINSNKKVRFVWSKNPPSGTVDIGRTVNHEIGHLLGLLHFPVGPPPELMEPSISHIILPQPTEAVYASKLYGQPVRNTPPTAPGDDVLTVEELRIDVAGKKYKLSGKVGPLQLVVEE